MNKKCLEAAEVINRAYDVPSTCDLSKKYAYFMVFDDDITSVLESIHIYKYLKNRNPDMKFVAVGGEGLLAIAFKVMRFAARFRQLYVANSFLEYETEGARLKRVARALGVGDDDIILADEGKNTSDNLRAMSQIAKGEKTLVVSTQRLAMVFKQSADYQCNTHPEDFGCKRFDYDLLVIHQTVKETLHWYNFQIAGSGRVACQLYASLVRRFELYDDIFCLKPFEPSEEVKKADEFLRSKFIIKQRLSGMDKLRTYLQYLPIFWDIFWHASDYLIEERDAIAEAFKKPVYSEASMYADYIR